MSAWSAVHGIVARDLARVTRQTSRLLGGVARPFMWLLLVGTGYNTIARLDSGLPYQAFVFPGIVVMMWQTLELVIWRPKSGSCRDREAARLPAEIRQPR